MWFISSPHAPVPANRLSAIVVFSVWMACTSAIALGQDSRAKKAAQPSQNSPAKEQLDRKEDGEGSAAERINGIRKLLEADRALLEELQSESETLEKEFEQASRLFEEADKAVTDSKPPPAENETPAAASDDSEVSAELLQARAAARDRFDRVIGRRKAVQSQLETLAEKISLEEQALERALELVEPATVPQASDQSREGTVPAVDAKADAAASESPADKNEAEPVPSILSPLGPLAPAKEEKKSSAPTESATKQSTRPPDQSLIEARKQLSARQQQLRIEQDGAELLDRSIDVFQRDLENARQLLESVRSEIEAMETELAKVNEQSDPAGDRRGELEDRLERLRSELKQQSERVAESEQLLERLRERKTTVAQRIEKVQSDLNSAERQLWFAESPLAPRRIYAWFAEVGPKWLAVIIAMTAAWWTVRLLSRRIASGLLWKSNRGTDYERQARADTLGRVFQSAGSMAVLVLGILALLQQTGIDVTVLLGGAAVIGAAIAFGSQNLIRDYFSGFMILAENQYSVGNVVRIGDKSGVVEDISLRLTVLRDEEGVVHFIPHNTITTVSNLTHGWSRAVFAIGVGYQEDVDHVISLLRQLALELRKDPDFGQKVIADPEMQGVDALGDSAVVVKFLLKTKPLQQWSVKREMLRRIKKRFDQERIEIPFPHQTVFYRNLEDDESSGDSEENSPAMNGRSQK